MPSCPVRVKKITTSSGYNSTGDLLTSVTDAAGNTVTYAYNTPDEQMLGLPGSVTTPNGTQTFTDYDALYNRATQTGIANVVDLQYTYSSGNLTKITRSNQGGVLQTYNLGYDVFGNMTSIKVGNRNLGTYNYNAVTGVLNSQTYGNGDTVTYTYDNLGRVKTTTYSDGLIINYAYSGEGDLYSVTSQEDGVTTKYINTTDSLGRPVYSEKLVNGTTNFRVGHKYDDIGRLSGATWQFTQNGASYANSYTYNNLGKVQGMVSGVMGTGYSYDELLRLSQIDSEINVADRTYTYRDIDTTKTTNQVTKLSYPTLKNGYNFNYTYDNMGNIATYSLTCANTGYNEAQFTYTYDQQGQLTKATDGSVTFNYAYDTTGNITSANGHSYTYGNSDWKDLLTAYDGQSISYDEIGNPTSYYNGTRWTFNWENGRRLTSASGGGHTISYTYDLDGLRTSKTVDGVVYNYYYAGSQLVRMTYGDYVLDFFYNANGTPIAMRQGYASNSNYVVYYYITNLQGDVIRLVDVNGSTAAYYEYDPYGNAIQAAGSHATINPLRYRGYVYDNESGLYYLQSRYYDPKICRFINADSFASTGQGPLGYNMFAYCKNSPINHTDRDGLEPEWAYSLDTDGDGEDDCYVYEYSYTKTVVINSEVLSYTVTGTVYVYTNKTAADMDSVESPQVFNKSTDLLVAALPDVYTDKVHNPTMYAYQAQHVWEDYYGPIFDCLENFTSEFGINWGRTKGSFITEWKAHNFFALLHKSAQDIDFDMLGEGMGYLDYFGKAIDRGLDILKEKLGVR